VVPLAPPPILGLGSGGGFAFVLQDLRGGDPKALAQVLRGLIVTANQDPQLTRVFSTFSATNPSIYLDIDRDKVQILGGQLSSVFQALQAWARKVATVDPSARRKRLSACSKRHRFNVESRAL
jgi:multidrug efflux pump subunit AcrB